MDSDRPVRVGELLVSERLLGEEDLQGALAIQGQEKDLRGRPIGEILVGMGFLSKDDLESLMRHPQMRKEIGAIAIEKGFIAEEQLELCLTEQRPKQLIGDLLIGEGLLTPDQVRGLLREQINSPRLANLAVKQELISRNDLENALKVQRAPRLLGEILCDLKLVDPLDLNHILQKYKKQLKLGPILLDLGYVTIDQLNAAREEEKSSKDSLAAILLRKKDITQAQLQVALSKQWNIPFKDLSDFAYSEKQKGLLVNFVSQKFAEKNLVLPISVRKGKLILATYTSQSIQILYDLKRMYNTMNVSCIFVTQEKFEELFEILYSRRLGDTESDTKEGMPRHDVGVDLIELDFDEDLGEMNEETPIYDIQDIEIRELVNFVLKYGIINGASDIHIEQDREGVRLRYRIDGILRSTDTAWLNEKLRENVSAVISRIKIMSSLDIAEKRLPQDGVFRINFCEKEKGQRIDIDCRVSTCRAIVGENVTIRILDPRKAQLGLEQLNHSPHVLEPLKMFLKSSAGLILVTGPTGSGKSSTLYGAMRYLYHPGIKVITAEDPIEYSFPGIMQTQVKPKIGLSFSRLLRSFLRLDPDVILVGEIRDEETAKIAFDAAQTGHLILSTLHTNDSISSVSRLLDLNVDHAQMASSLRCALAQRLVRKICSSCIQEYTPAEDEWGLLFRAYPSHLRFYKGQGCESCNFTGYRGQTVLSEIFVVDSEIAMAMNKEIGEDRLRKLALETGMKSMLDDGLLKLEETTLSEVIRVTPQEMIKAFRFGHYAWQDAESLFEVDSGNEEFQRLDGSSSNTFSIEDPIADGELIGLMYERYEGLAGEMNSNSDTFDADLFNEFVTSNYYRICEKHGCRSVTFSISKNQGEVEISAVPELNAQLSE